MVAKSEGPAAPATPAKGDVWYDTVSEQAFVWNGRGWVDMDDAAEHDGNAPPMNPDRPER